MTDQKVPSWLRSILVVSGLLVTAVISSVIAIATFFLLARVTNSILLMAVCAALVLTLSTAGNAWLLTRGLRASHPQRFVVWLTSGVFLLVSGLAALFVFRPLPYQQPQPRPATQFWQLSNGTSIAYIRVSGIGVPKETPVIFLQGGPGAPIFDSDITQYSQLAQDGFTVYLYDPVGTGFSSRLSDVRQYTMQRHVSDLEAIREQIGAEQVVLLGSSWGSTLAASYTAFYPNRVAKIIFSGPGALWDQDRFTFDYSRTAAVDVPREDRDSQPPEPRILVALWLLQINPNAAQNLVSDRELITHLDFLRGAPPGGGFCRGNAPDSASSVSEAPPINLYANIPAEASLQGENDPRPLLQGNATPVLILRGECDYVPWEAMYEYKQMFPNATLLIIPNTGHNLEKAELIMQATRAFLGNQALPLEPYMRQDPLQ